MSHPLDHALILSPLRATVTHSKLMSGRGSLRHSLYCGGLAPLMISLDQRFKPQRVVLIYDEEESAEVRLIESLLMSLTIEVERWPLRLSPLEEVAHQLDQKLKRLDNPLPLCVNGDYPLLSSICTQMFLSYDCPLLSCVNGHLYRLGARTQRIQLKPQIKLDDLIRRLGARVHDGWEGVWFEEHLEKLSHYLIGVAHGSADSLEVIQRLAKQANNAELLSPPVRGTEIAIPLFQDILDRFESAGCVELNQGRLLFSSELHRSYCAGGWLSLFAQAVLDKLSNPHYVWATRQDLQLELPYPSTFDRQISLTALVNSQLIFFFCVNSSSEYLEELLVDSSSLRAHFGAQVVWLSADTLPEYHAQTLNLNGVYLCQGEELKRLDQWMEEQLLS